MAAVRNLKNFQRGMEEVQEVWANKLERHLKQTTKQQSAIAMVIASVPHIVVSAFSISIILIARPGSSLFSWHPSLMSLSFMILMVEALLVFSPWFSPLLNSPRNDKMRWHWVSQACALCCAFTGLAVIFYNKYTHGAVHFATWHGFSGIIVCCLLVVQTTGGILTMYPDFLPFKVKRAYIKLMHAFSGTFVTFTGAMLTVALGLYSSWFTANIQNPVIWCLCFACPVIVECVVGTQFIRNYVLLLLQKH